MNRRDLLKCLSLFFFPLSRRSLPTDFVYGHVDQPYSEYMCVYFNGKFCTTISEDGKRVIDGLGVQEADAVGGWIRCYIRDHSKPEDSKIHKLYGDVQILFENDAKRHEWIGLYGKTEYRKFLV